MRERVLRFRHADYDSNVSKKNMDLAYALTWKAAITLSGVVVDLLTGKIAELNAIRTINFFPNYGNLFLDWKFQVVEEFELRIAFANVNDSFCQVSRTGSSLGPVVAHNSRIGPSGKRFLSDQCKLSIRIRPVKWLVGNVGIKAATLTQIG